MICLHYVPPDKVIATIVSTFCTNAQRCIPSHAVFVAKQNIMEPHRERYVHEQ